MIGVAKVVLSGVASISLLRKLQDLVLHLKPVHTGLHYVILVENLAEKMSVVELVEDSTIQNRGLLFHPCGRFAWRGDV